MAFAINDRVKETSTTTGTGTFSLGGAVSGFQTFVAGVGGGNTTYYAIVNDTGTEFEIGIGTVTDSGTDTLSRDTILESSNSDSAVSFSSGTKTVFCTLPAEKVVVTPGSGAMTISPPTDLTVDAGNDIVFDAAGNAIRFKSNGTEVGQASLASQDLTILSSVSDKDLIFKGNDGGSTITALTLDMSDAGTATFNHDIILGDNSKAQFGAGLDLNVYHSGSHSYIENNTGDLVLLNNSDDKDIIFQSDDGSGGTTTYFYVDGSGSRIIFEQITRHMDNIYAGFGSDADLRIFHDGSNSKIQQSSGATGDLIIENRVSDEDIIFKGSDSGSDFTALTLDMSDAGTATFNHDIVLGDNSKALFGASSDLEILHNSSSGNSFISDVGTGSLIISSNQVLFQSADKSETLMQVNENSDVKLFHDNTERLATTASGIDVSGSIQVDNGGSLGFGGTNYKIEGSSSANHRIAFHTDGSERMRLDSNGKLIIADTASHTDDFLQIESPASGGGHGIQLRRNDSNNDQQLGRILFGNNTDTDIATIAVKTDGANDSGALFFSTQPASGSSTERMRINSSGNVGIGNSNPSVALDVTGDFKVSGSITIGSTAITSTAAELNFSDGVTSNIQTQLDTKTTQGFALAMAVAL
jgi:hypothetical protein